ncbi:MAG: hypothetical protein KatS3mg130_0686 [Candidatus Sumerlaea sp.]|nr:MAG: hypothetical protein KatS3mg130_0686 [Candidatus Sumerlaea sp.]
MRSRRPRKLTKADYFEFHRPLWQKGLPLFLLVAIWGAVASYGWLLSTHVERSGIAVLQAAAVELWRQGVSVQMAVWTAAVLSLPLVVALYFACEKLLITPEAVVRLLPFRSRQIMRWVEVDEVLIRDVRYWLEGSGGTHRELVLYGRPRLFPPWRPRLSIRSREFEGYRFAERLAVQIAVPAIATRLRLELMRRGGLVFFGTPSFFHDTVMVVYAGVAAALWVAWGFPTWWQESPLWWRHATLVVAAVLALAALRRLFVRYYALDLHSLYIYRRLLSRKKIPLPWIRSVGVHKGVLVIEGRREGSEKLKRFVSERRFFRNRGVFLAMIRLALQELKTKHEDSQRILPAGPAGLSDDQAVTSVPAVEPTAPVESEMLSASASGRGPEATQTFETANNSVAASTSEAREKDAAVRSSPEELDA